MKMLNEMLRYLCTLLLSYFIGSCFAEKNKQTGKLQANLKLILHSTQSWKLHFTLI